MKSSKILILFFLFLRIQSGLAQTSGFIQYPKGYKPDPLRNSKNLRNKQANKNIKNSKFNNNKGQYVQVSLEWGDTFNKINQQNYEGSSFGISFSNFYRNSFTQFRLNRNNLSDDLGRFSKIGFFVGYSPIISTKIRPYIALGISRNSFKSKDNPNLNDFNSFAPSLMMGSSIYTWGRTSLGIKYIHEKNYSDAYSQIDNNDFLLDFSFLW